MIYDNILEKIHVFSMFKHFVRLVRSHVILCNTYADEICAKALRRHRRASVGLVSRWGFAPLARSSMVGRLPDAVCPAAGSQGGVQAPCSSLAKSEFPALTSSVDAAGDSTAQNLSCPESTGTVVVG